MTAKVIRRLECNYLGSVEEFSFPDWSQIEGAIRSLESKPGRIDLLEAGDNGGAITITGNPGVYGVDVLVDDENAMMLVNEDAKGEDFVEMFDQECRDDQVVDDLDTVVSAVKSLVEFGKYVNSKPWIWKHYSI